MISILDLAGILGLLLAALALLAIVAAGVAERWLPDWKMTRRLDDLAPAAVLAVIAGAVLLAASQAGRLILVGIG